MNGRTYFKRLSVLMLTVFVDMIGFLIVLPLLPFYAEKLGASPTGVGALISTFALAQLVSAPLWGRLSDRYGRRPIIIGGLLISAGAYVLFESADTVWILFASRFVQGAGAGTVAVVQAYVSDAVPREERAKALGWLTAAASAGVMIGPAIGSLSADGPLGPGYVAAGLCVLNAMMAYRWLPESSASAGKTGSERPQPRRGATGDAIRAVLLRPRTGASPFILVYAFGMMAFMAMNGVLALYLERKFGVTEKTIGWFYVYVGGLSLIMRSLVLGPAVKRFGEIRVLRVGTFLIAAGLFLVSFGRNFVELGLAIPLIPIGTALVFPATSSLVSARAPEDETGLMLGVQQSFGGVARLVGPLWAGLAFEKLGIQSPFWIASGLMLLVGFFALTADGGATPPTGGSEESQAADDPTPLDAVVPSEGVS